MSLTIKSLTAALKKAGAPLFKGELNVTLVGIRMPTAEQNTFNDVLCVLFQQDGKKQLLQYAMTCDPGAYYLENPLNKKGTAVLVPGHYKSCWRLGLHRGKYHALVQVGEMAVYRDNDKNRSIDIEKAPIESGVFGINLHRAATNNYTLVVDKFSAGCQVLANIDDFNQLMDVVTQSANKYGPVFSYTLLNADDVHGCTNAAAAGSRGSAK